MLWDLPDLGGTQAIINTRVPFQIQLGSGGHRPLVRHLQGGDIELLHLEEGLGHRRDLLPAALLHHLAQVGRHQLPGNAELVLDPTIPLAEGVFVDAHQGFSPLGKIFPDLVQRLSRGLLPRRGFAEEKRIEIHDEGNRRVEFEQRFRADGLELLPSLLEGGDFRPLTYICPNKPFYE